MRRSTTQLLRKLHNLCSEQDRPELNKSGCLTVLDNISVPQIVEKVLRYCPRHPVQRNFIEQLFHANNDILMSDCISQNVEAKVIDHIHSLMVGYTNKRLEMRRNETFKIKKWLNDHDILAVFYDKGTGFCLMKGDTYISKCHDILAYSPINKEETNLL